MVKKRAGIEIDGEIWRKMKAIAAWNNIRLNEAVETAFKWYVANATSNGTKGLDLKVEFTSRTKEKNE